MPSLYGNVNNPNTNVDDNVTSTEIPNNSSQNNTPESKEKSISNTRIGSVTGNKVNSTSYSSVDVAAGQFGYELRQMAITKEQAIVIDNFFEHYGYAVMRNKVPNLDTRPHWNYVKTGDAYITGNCPADALNKIIKIFNRGITFWKKPSEVGNYSLNNH